MENQKLSDVVTLNVAHTFTPEEMLQNTDLLVKAVQDKDTEENNKKVANAGFKDKIDRLAADVKLYSGYLSNGFHYRDKTCELWLNFETKKRQYYLKESGELIKEEDFHASDYQKIMDFEQKQKEQADENNAVGELAEKE